jgi:hypothetical protein
VLDCFWGRVLMCNVGEAKDLHQAGELEYYDK